MSEQEEIARLRAELDTTRADLESLRVGMVWLGAERDALRRVARLLVAAWRQERQRADYWEGSVDLYRVALQRAREPKTDDATE